MKKSSKLSAKVRTLPKNHAFSLNVYQFVALVVACFVLSIAISECYLFVSQWGLSFWLSAAMLNSALTVLLLAVGQFDVSARKSLRVLYAYLPSLTVFLGVLLLVGVGRVLGGAGEPVAISSKQVLWVIWIPFVEEAVFRVGIGSYFRKAGGLVWGGYFSAVVFSLVHSFPTIDRLSNAQIGLNLGPFLLGLCCEAIYALTGRYLAIVCFHAVCNLTVILFLLGDSRWLEWLDFLYL